MNDKLLVGLFLLLMVLNAADVATTVYGLSLGAAEANHRVADMMNDWSLIGAMVFKFALVLILGLVSLAAYWYALHYDKAYIKHTKAALITVYLCGVLFYTYVVLQNINVLILQGS